MSMQQRDGWIWLDGEFTPWKDAKVHILTHTLHYGTGVFEGVRAYPTDKGPAIFRLQDHTSRLFNSAAIFKMKMPFTQDEINAAHKEVVKKNKLDSAYIRPLVFYGAEDMGLRADKLEVHCAIAAWQWGTYLGEENMINGIRIRTSSFSRYHPNSAMSRAKACGHYINSMLALQEALADGYDEALMLDVDGNIAEGSGENVFIVTGNTLYTPSLNSILDGITRRTIMQIAKDQGMTVVEKSLTRDEAYIADEMFLTGTAAEVTPVRELDQRAIGNGKRGPITEKLQTIFFDAVHGKLPQYHQWNSLV